MSSLLRKRVHDRFPKKWLIVLLFFVSAELPGTASGERPAPGTGAPSAFNGATTTTSFSSSQTRGPFTVEIVPVPHRKHSLGFGTIRHSLPSAQANGQKKQTNTQ